MVTAEALAARKVEIARSPDLRNLLARLGERAAPVLARLPPVPDAKALLSTDGGVCPEDRSPLTFDPWSPGAHRCPRCGRTYTGERHDRHWARFQHLWLAERAAHLAALAALGDDRAAGVRARELLLAYAACYWRYPNRDNVLGPSRLFFSTYLESLWLCNYLAAAMLLREAGALDDATARAVAQVADEAANLIGEFDEGFSNRQTWNNAALAAIAVWFEDEDLAQRAIEGPTGLVAHLRGYRDDGMWYEGENYHLFALRGLLTGAGWSRLAGVDFFADPRLATRVRAALRAPAVSALPDFTFPARKDARFGVSLAQPMYLELWEVGLGMLGSGEREAGPDAELEGWLAALYKVPAPTPELFESYLHDAPIEPLPAPRSRRDLSWWSLLWMLPELPPAPEPPPWTPRSELLRSQGLAVLRPGGRYVSLECGPVGGGHGHPDRLHLTLHADGVHWLPDFGAGSYVSRDLLWYRSPLAHNAPLLGGADPWGDAVCEAFDAHGGGEWAWARGRAGDVARTVVSGPAYVLDLVEAYGREERTLELPWHFAGMGDVRNGGRWKPGELAGEFVTAAERFVPDAQGPLVLELTAHGARLTAFLLFDGELLRAEGPGRPGSGKREAFYVVRARGRNLRLLSVLEPSAEQPQVRAVRFRGDLIEVETGRGTDRHHVEAQGWLVESGAARGGGRVRLGGRQEPEPPFRPILELDRPAPALGAAVRLGHPPALDGTLDGFDTGAPLLLELEDQYRRSEEAYAGPEEFSAVAHAGWDDEALYLAVQVTKPDLCLRAGDAAPLLLDNEPDDIHSDGLQVYLGAGAGAGPEVTGFLIVPEPHGRGLRVRTVGGAVGGGEPSSVRGAWRRTEAGYCVTLAVAWPGWQRAYAGGRVRFDLIINEMLPGRVRRAGQLVWSGGDGWVWLRGDRQDPERFGVLELAG